MSTLYRKNKTEIEISRKAKKRKVKRSSREAKQRKERRRKKKRGSKGVSPFALQIQTFQKKERIKGLATKGKITRKKKRESRECPLTILPIVVLQITYSTSMPR